MKEENVQIVKMKEMRGDEEEEKKLHENTTNP